MGQAKLDWAIAEGKSAWSKLQMHDSGVVRQGRGKGDDARREEEEEVVVVRKGGHVKRKKTHDREWGEGEITSLPL